MSSNKRKSIAKGVLLLYALISVTYPLAHKDYVPLSSQFCFSRNDFSSHSATPDADDFVCPAHQFAQSTTSPAIARQIFNPQITFFFLRIGIHVEHFVEPLRSLSTRAPPQA